MRHLQVSMIFCWEIFSLTFLITPFNRSRVAELWFFTSHLCQGISFFKIAEYHKPWYCTINTASIVLDLEDEISELSSRSSYPGSPGAFSQILLDTPSGISQVYVDDDDDLNSVCHHGTSLAPIPIVLHKRKQLLPRSWVWGKPKSPLGYWDSLLCSSIVFHIIRRRLRRNRQRGEEKRQSVGTRARKWSQEEGSVYSGDSCSACLSI